MKNGKAGRLEEITTELLKNSSDKLHRMLTRMFKEKLDIESHKHEKL